MTDEPSNDNVRAESNPGPLDAPGQAAILLVESLLHALIARSLISVSEALEIVEIASEVKTEIWEEMGTPASTLRKSLAILQAISTSLKHDLPPA
ncbi:hypothetical protein FHS85_001501 [Rhodoligotrophos appendicifer]|uniref:hypothetical protein n=1 Tax=Rhodoligotrophos appendicifer TaxID=987056 RepID=UPI001185EF30|nr:hypothetical protein [Rhodoligotrophos appendicifer]